MIGVGVHECHQLTATHLSFLSYLHLANLYEVGRLAASRVEVRKNVNAIFASIEYFLWAHKFDCSFQHSQPHSSSGRFYLIVSSFF